MNNTQKVNEKCNCGSNIKYKKCCMKQSIQPEFLQQIFNKEINELPFLIEGSLRLQSNIIAAKLKFGLIFYAKIIMTNYFGDDEKIVTLVCKDDESLILGKPRYSKNFTKSEYKIKLVDNNMSGLYSVEIVENN